MKDFLHSILFFALLTAVVSYPAGAQEQTETNGGNQSPFQETVTESFISSRDTLNVNYISKYRSRFRDNWFISASGGVNLLCAEEDHLMPFGQRIAPFAKFGIGRELFPELTLSLGVGYGQMRGWNTGAPGLYKWEADWKEQDPVRQYYEARGIDCSAGYTQKMEFIQVSLDIMLNIRSMIMHNAQTARKVDIYGLLGPEFFGLLDRNGYFHTEKVGFRFGGVLNVNFTERVSFTSSLIAMLADATFDNEIGKGRRMDAVIGASAGLVVRIGHQGYRVERLVTSNQYELMKDVIANIKEEYEEPVNVSAMVLPLDLSAEEGALLAPSIVFDNDKVTYSEELQMVNLFRISQFMAQNPELKILVIGNIEVCDKNLARRRAELIRTTLVERYGIAPSRLKVVLKDVNQEYKVSGREQTVNFGVQHFHPDNNTETNK